MSGPSHRQTSSDGMALQVGEQRILLRPGQTLVLGSGAGCDVRLQHKDVAPQHALLRVESAGVLLDDLDSPAGTFVDGRRVHQFDLEVGDIAVLGHVPIHLLRAAPDPGVAGIDAPVVPRRPSMRNLPIRMSDDASFRDLMAEELRRTPWFTLSVLIHALMLLLLHHLLQPPPVGAELAVGIVAGDDADDMLRDMSALAEEPIVVEEPASGPESELELQLEDLTESESPLDPTEFNWPAPGGAASPEMFTTRLSSRDNGNGDVLETGGAGVDSGGFRESVTGVRKSGLEIVFVFDSTGSMDSVLDITKARIARMLKVLQALVPDARVGIVTYRDHGRNEDYLTRSIPLGNDFYRAINFMNVIRARGGGNRPEAVRDGLKIAFDQPWTRGARRVVVLIGDAPAHGRSMRTLSREAKSFARVRDSHVHGIVTSPNGGRELREDTLDSFRQIVRAGNGVCLPFSDEEGLMLQILSLAFGEEYRSNLEEVYEIVDTRATRPAVGIVAALRGGGHLRRRLARNPVPDDLVRAIIRRPDKALTLELIDILSRPRYPEPGRQAASYALQHILELREPPLDPERGGRLSPEEARRLEQVVNANF